MFKILASMLLFLQIVLSGYSYSSLQPSNVENLEFYLSKIPNGVSSIVFDEGNYHISIVNEPGSEYGIRHIVGLTIPELKQIYIKDDASVYRQAVVHEVFHAFDAEKGFISEKDDFESIYQAEKDSIIITGYTSSGQHKENVHEYFAEAGQMYVYDPDTLEKTAPETYWYFKKLLN